MHPPRENSHCKRAVRRGAALAESTACARRCRVCLCYTIWPTPIIRCRSADLVGVQTNFRLPWHSSMRRAKQCRIPQAVRRRATVTRALRSARGCNKKRLAESSWRSHVHRTSIPQAGQPYKPQTRNVGGRGGTPLVLLWGIQRGCSLREENTPFVCVQCHRHCLFYARPLQGNP